MPTRRNDRELMDRQQQMGRTSRHRGIAICVACASGILGTPGVYAQFVHRTPNVGISTVGRVGRSGVDSNNAAIGWRGAGIAGSTPTAGNYVNPSRSALGFASGRAQRASAVAPVVGGGALLAGAAASRFARPVAMGRVTGAHTFTERPGRAVPIPYSPRNASLLHGMATTARLGHTVPARHPVYGHQIRDRMSQVSLDNAPPVDSYLETGTQRRSYSDMLAQRIEAVRRQSLEQGWELFAQNEFGRAIERFEAAEHADRTDPEAVVGIICAAVAHDSSELAYTVLLRAVSRGPDLFSAGIDLRDKHADPELATRLAAHAGRSARQNPDAVHLAAMSAFLHWFSGQRDAALGLAEQIHATHRTSPFAAMAAQMRGERVPASAEDLTAGEWGGLP